MHNPHISNSYVLLCGLKELFTTNVTKPTLIKISNLFFLLLLVMYMDRERFQ